MATANIEKRPAAGLALFLKNVGFMTFAKLGVYAVSILWQIYLARTFSEGDFGRYTFVSGLSLLLIPLADLGAGTIVTREVAKNKERSREYLGQILVLRVFFSILCAFAIVAAVLLFSGGEGGHLLTSGILAAAALLLNRIGTSAVSVFDGLEDLKPGAANAFFKTFLSVLFGVPFVYLGWGIEGVFLAFLVSAVIVQGAQWIYVLAKKHPPALRLAVKPLLAILKDSWPIGVAAFLFMLYYRVDRIMVFSLAGPEAAAVYAVAAMFLGAVIEFSWVPYSMGLLPLLSRLYTTSRRRYESAVAMSFSLFLAFSIITALVIFATGDYFIGIILPKYARSAEVLEVLAVALVFIIPYALLRLVLTIENRQFTALLVALLGACVNLLSNYFLIKRYGYMGAAYATVATQALVFCVYITILGRRPGIYPLKSLPVVIGGAALTGHAMWGIRAAGLRLADNWPAVRHIYPWAILLTAAAGLAFIAYFAVFRRVIAEKKGNAAETDARGD